MPTTTAITAVNRVRRRLKYDDLSDFSDNLGPTLLDFVNESIHEVLETAEWDFLVRHDGELVMVPRIRYTGTFLVDSPDYINVDQTDGALFTGNFRTRLVITNAGEFEGTSFAVESIGPNQPTNAWDRYNLETDWPGGPGTSRDAIVYVVDYQLPATVRDVLSVRHEEEEVAIQFVDRNTTFDRYVPTGHLDESDSPDLVIVGGSVTSTFYRPYQATAGTPTTALGLMVWPVPTVPYILSYSYRYLHPDLVATTDVIDAPLSHVDMIVDKACCKAYRSAVANDPDMADRIEVDISRRFSRLWAQNSPQPNRRMELRSFDTARGPTQFGSRPANSRVFYTP